MKNYNRPIGKSRNQKKKTNQKNRGVLLNATRGSKVAHEQGLNKIKKQKKLGRELGRRRQWLQKPKITHPKRSKEI